MKMANKYKLYFLLCIILIKFNLIKKFHKKTGYLNPVLLIKSSFINIIHVIIPYKN